MSDLVAHDLHLHRVCLDHTHPFWTLESRGTRETLIYCLVGRLHIYADGACLGHFGGRSTVQTPQAHVVRFRPGTSRTIHCVLDGWAADCLVASCAVGDADSVFPSSTPYIHWNDTVFHEVGGGTHRRRVGEVPTPAGFTLSCGETFQEAGMTSSWPAHASEEDLVRYTNGETTWQEQFYCVCPKPGIVTMDGYFFPFPEMPRKREVRPITNGSIVPMPLGSHAVTAAPDAFFWYFWVYCGSALEKRYNRFSTDVGIYLK